MLSEGTPVQIINTLLKAQAHLEQLSQKLSPASDNQQVIDIAGEYLKVPLFYFDSSYRILAITKGFCIPGDSEWTHMSEKGFLSPHSIHLMQDSGDLDMLADKRDPFPYRADYYPFESIVCNIWNRSTFLSRLNMLCINGHPNELNIQECRIICSVLQRIALSSGNSLSGTGPLNNLVLDLLRGVQLPEELINHRLSAVPHLQKSLLQVCCIESNVRNDLQVPGYYASLIGDMFAAQSAATLVFENRIILLLYAPGEEAFGFIHEKLIGLLTSQSLKGGVSNSFSRLITLRDHYIQALTTVSIGTHDPGLNLFRETYFDHILSYIPRKQAAAMVSSGIIHLMKLQDDYQFPLAATLRIYLENGCNLQMTADSLFIHKNTALYRINHIKEILGPSCMETSDQRMELLFSFKILDKYPYLSDYYI